MGSIATSDLPGLQEDKIRLEACTEFLHTDLRRYSCLMAFEGGVQPWHWRKCA